MASKLEITGLDVLDVVKAGEIITNGPSKYDLMVSLFSKGEHVAFTLAGEISFNFMTSSVMAEDGSKNRWILEGYAKLPNDEFFMNGYRLKIYFDSKARSGKVISYNKI
jgi:hypothetical protein